MFYKLVYLFGICRNHSLNTNVSQRGSASLNIQNAGQTRLVQVTWGLWSYDSVIYMSYVVLHYLKAHIQHAFLKLFKY